MPLPLVVGIGVAMMDPPRPVSAQSSCVSSPNTLTITGANPKNLSSISVTGSFTATLEACKDKPGVYRVIRGKDGKDVGDTSQFNFADDKIRFAEQAILFSRLSAIPNPTASATKIKSQSALSTPPSNGSSNRSKDSTDMTFLIIGVGTLFGAGAVGVLFLRSRRKNKTSGVVDGEGRYDRTLGNWLSGEIPGDFMQNAEVSKNAKGETHINYGHWDDTGPPQGSVIIGELREQILKRFIMNAKKNKR